MFAVFEIIKYNIESFTRSAEEVGTYNGSIKKKDVIDATKTAKSIIIFISKRHLEN